MAPRRSSNRDIAYAPLNPSCPYAPPSVGCAATAREVEALSVGNLKRTFVDHGRCVDWNDDAVAQDPLFLRQAVQVKNVWTPYGD